MEKITILLVLAVIFILLYIYEVRTQCIFSVFTNVEYVSKPHNTLLILVDVSVIYLCMTFHVPLFCFYLFFYLFKLIKLRISKKPFSRDMHNSISIHLIHLSVAHMISLALMSLLTGKTVAQLFSNSYFALISIAMALSIIIIMSIVFPDILGIKYIATIKKEEAYYKKVGYYIWFSVVYVMFDSITCMFSIPCRVLAWVLLGSSFFVELQLHLFLKHSYKIVKVLAFEKEYLTMEEEKQNLLKQESKLKEIVYTDKLTGTYTRKYIMELLKQWLKEGKQFSLIYIDLDGLKMVNDRYGHQAGDEYLIFVTRRINQLWRKLDVMARIGGDEFLVAMPDTAKEEAQSLIKEAQMSLYQNKEYISSFSFGIAVASENSSLSAEELIRQADALMYADKNAKKSVLKH